MPKKYPGLSLKEHAAIGAKLAAVNMTVNEVHKNVTANYSATSRAIKAVNTLADNVASAREVLEMAMLNDRHQWPASDQATLNTAGVTSVYFPTSTPTQK